jgi:methionyl-tRNA formyltransferase
MRIEFLTQDDPVYLLCFFDELLRSHATGIEIVNVGLCRAMGKRRRTKLMRELMALYGIKGFGRLAWCAIKAGALSYWPKGRDAKTYSSIAQLCRAYGIGYCRVKDPNSSAYISEIKSRRPDCLVSVACPHILKADILSLPPLGCINIHHAPLPQYKGMMPTFWQLYHGQKRVGLTIHYMSARVDEGDALYQTLLDVHPTETLHELICRSKRHAAHCLIEVLSKLAADQLQPLKLDQTQSTSFTFPTLGEIAEFHLRGYRAI